MAVFRGSSASGAGGLLLVFTAQNRQPRVEVSPRSMIVAVAMPSPSPPAPPPPFQHCTPSPLQRNQTKTGNNTRIKAYNASNLKFLRLAFSGACWIRSYLSDVGALGLDADGVELELAERLPQPRVLLPLRRPLPQPCRLLHLGVPPRVRPRRRPTH